MKKILVVLFIMATLSACKDEVKIERNLWKNGGEWHVSSWRIWSNGMESELIGADVKSVVFTFNKDKEAIIVINGDAGDVYTYEAQYENSDSQLIFTNLTDQATGTVDYPSMTYYLMWEKDLMDLKTTNGFAGGDTETLILEKQ